MNKLNELYNINIQIIIAYKEAIYSSTCTSSTYMYNITISFLKSLIEKEQNIINSIDLEEIDKYLKMVSLTNKEYDATISLRIKKKLLNYKDILLKNSISSTILDNKYIPNDIEFGINDLIETMININTIKILQRKIYELNIFTTKDAKFINNLKLEFLNLKFNFLLYNPVFETIALYHNINIDEIPIIDINQLKSINDNLNDDIETKIMIYIKKIITRLTRTELFTNNPKHVFKLLINATKLEILLSYVDQSAIQSFYFYCNSIVDEKNTKSINYTKNLIKSKLK